MTAVEQSNVDERSLKAIFVFIRDNLARHRSGSSCLDDKLRNHLSYFWGKPDERDEGEFHSPFFRCCVTGRVSSVSSSMLMISNKASFFLWCHSCEKSSP